jgi:hypothetical protein
LYKDIPKYKYNDKLLKLIELNKSHLILLFSALLFYSFQSYSNDNSFFSYVRGQTVEQQPQYLSPQQASQSFQPAVAVKITSPATSQNVSTGELTITGTSTDTAARECQVYTDWNDRKPFQRVVAAGPAGNGDYSRWNFTYTATYHEITNGTNELTSKISCLANPTNLTKWYSINVTGVEGLIPPTEGYVQSISQVQSNSTGNSTGNSSGLVPSSSTINAAQINSPSLDSIVGSDDSDDDQDANGEGENNDNDSEEQEEQEEQEEEENNRDFTDGDFVNDEDDSNDEVSNDEITNDEDDSNDEVSNDEVSNDEVSNDEVSNDEVSNDEITNDEDDSNDEVSNDEVSNDEVSNDEVSNDEVTNDEDDLEEGENDGNTGLVPIIEYDREEEEEESNPINDELEEDVVEENEDDNKEALGEDNGDSNDNIEVNGDIGDNVDEEKPEESDTETFMDLPELSISTIPSIPAISVPNENEIAQSEDEDDCDIDDAGFPFCDGGQGERESNEDEDDCDIDDAGFPFCDGRRD